MCDLYSGSSFISQPVQEELDGKVSLVSSTTQSIGSGLDVSGNINLSAGSEFQINGVPIGGDSLPTIDTIVITDTGLTLSQTDITYITGYTHAYFGAILYLNTSTNLPAGKTKTIIATELNGKIVVIYIPKAGGYILSPNLTKNGQQQSFLWDGTKWTYDNNKITTNLLGWGGELGLPSDDDTTIQSELQQSGDINLLTGKKYKINDVNLEAVAETLSNKTISGTSNTLLNLPISSTTGLQTALDGKVALVSATTQSIGSGLDVSGNINLTAGSEFQINGVPIGGGSNLPTIDTLVITDTGLTLSQTDITYIIGYTHNFYGATIELNSENLPAGKTKTIIATELNGKIVIILDRLGNPISPNLTKNGQQQTFQWNGIDWTFDDNKITTNLLGWGGELGLPSNNNTTIQSELQESGDINLLTGKKYKINSVNLEAVAETLTNKTISGSSNTITNLPISSTTGLQTALDGKVALVSATKQTIGSSIDVSGNINLPTGSQYQINGVSITAGGGGGTPGGVEGSVQYNASGAFAGDEYLKYDPSTATLTLQSFRPDIINFNGSKVSIGAGNEFYFGQGNESVAVGKFAGYNGQEGMAVAIGASAGDTAQGSGSVALGWKAGFEYQGSSSIAIGNQAGLSNQYQNSICINATGAGLNTPDSNTCVVAPIRTETDLTGLNSVYYNTTTKEMVTGVQGGGGGGSPAGVEGSVQYNASGAFAGESDFNYSASTNTLTLTDGTIRPSAINFNSEKIAITGNSTIQDQEYACVAIGSDAGKVAQAQFSVAIGFGAGNTIQGTNSVAVGRNAGYEFQSYYCVAMGHGAGRESQGNSGVALGDLAGAVSQGSASVAVGKNSGELRQSFNSVAIGHEAGKMDQKEFSTAIGYRAGSEDQGEYTIALGEQAGYVRQGQNSIAIGREAGTYEQPPRTIMINASGLSLNSTTTDALFIKPIRNETDISGFLQLYYNPTTGELVYN
jgi:hypothetical protein